MFFSAFNHLMDDRDRILEDCRMAQPLLCNIGAIDIDLSELRRELEVVAALSCKEIHRNAHSLERQDTSDHQGYLERYEQARARIETLEQEKLERTAKSKTFGRFIHSIQGTSELLTQFDEALWVAIIDNVTVTKAGGMIFKLKNNLEIVIDIL